MLQSVYTMMGLSCSPLSVISPVLSTCSELGSLLGAEGLKVNLT